MCQTRRGPRLRKAWQPATVLFGSSPANSASALPRLIPNHPGLQARQAMEQVLDKQQMEKPKDPQVQAQAAAHKGAAGSSSVQALAGHHTTPKPTALRGKPGGPSAEDMASEALVCMAGNSVTIRRGCKLTAEYAAAKAEQRDIKKTKAANQRRLRLVRAKRARLCKRMEGMKEEEMMVMQDLFYECQERKAARQNGAGQSASKRTKAAGE